jgi:patatin-like phospholipase/acyl hydrolase
MKKKLKIVVAIDGGGIKGLIAAYQLLMLERELGGHLCDYVDLVAGTSTGSILAAAIASGMSMETIVDLYIKEGPYIFGIPREHKIRSMWGLRGSKYDESRLEEILIKYFKDAKLDDLKTDFLATAYNITDGKPRFFSKRQEGDYRLTDVVQASSTAPTYFEPKTIKDKDYIDGGVFCANPAMSAFAEIKDIYDIPAKDIFILSVGNGDRSEGFAKTKKWFKFRWVKPLIDLMMSADSGVVHYQLVRTYRSINRSDNYWRLNSKLADNVSKDMADASEENLIALMDFAKDCAKKNEYKIKKIAKTLKNNQ